MQKMIKVIATVFAVLAILGLIASSVFIGIV